MNAQAQEEWKETWRAAQEAMRQGNIKLHDEYLEDLFIHRREAALERRIATLERENAAQARELNHYHRLQSDIDMGVIVLEMPR